jgi:hypothetical protein
MRSTLSTLLVAGFALSAGPASADCICLNRGVEVVEGNTACIKTANGGRMALCEKNLNVTNWKFLGEECPVAAGDIQTAPALHAALLDLTSSASAPRSDQTAPQH